MSQPIEYAFPLKAPSVLDGSGMTLRDYFAAKALHALIELMGSNPDIEAKDCNEVTEDVLAQQAYCFADAMLTARGAA